MWGEAAHRERQGESCYLEGEALRLGQIAQGERYDGDANHDTITDALDGKEGFIPGRVVLDLCEITDDVQRKSRATTKSIKDAMTKNGWRPEKRRLKDYNGNVTNQIHGWVKGTRE